MQQLRISEARGGGTVDCFCTSHEFTDSLTDFSFVGSQEIDLAFDTEFVTSGDARLSVLTLTHQEW